MFHNPTMSNERPQNEKRVCRIDNRQCWAEPDRSSSSWSEFVCKCMELSGANEIPLRDVSLENRLGYCNEIRAIKYCCTTDSSNRSCYVAPCPTILTLGR
jgi:hypothetical protein